VISLWGLLNSGALRECRSYRNSLFLDRSLEQPEDVVSGSAAVSPLSGKSPGLFAYKAERWIV
jgi:hypothetical protein